MAGDDQADGGLGADDELEAISRRAQRIGKDLAEVAFSGNPSALARGVVGSQDRNARSKVLSWVALDRPGSVVRAPSPSDSRARTLLEPRALPSGRVPGR